MSSTKARTNGSGWLIKMATSGAMASDTKDGQYSKNLSLNLDISLYYSGLVEV
jgi:hypothetical protein